MPNRPGHPTIASSKMPIKGLHEHTRRKNSVDEFLDHRLQEGMLRMLKIAAGWLPHNHFDQQTCGLERFAVSSAY
jgi:hypothetical protein